MSLSFVKPMPQHKHQNQQPIRAKIAVNLEDLTKLGYKINKVNENRYNINGVLEVDVKGLKFFDLLKRTEGYIFSKKELMSSNPNLNAFVRNFFKNQ